MNKTHDSHSLIKHIISSYSQESHFTSRDAESIMCFNIHHESFSKDAPTNFDQLESESDVRNMLEVLTLALSKNCIGGSGFLSYENRTPEAASSTDGNSTTGVDINNVLFNEQGPKYECFIETLVKDSSLEYTDLIDDENFRGYRLWLFFFEEGLSLTTSLANAHQFYNKVIKPDRKSMPNRGFNAMRSRELKYSLIESNSTIPDMISTMYLKITGSNLTSGGIDFKEILKPRSIIESTNVEVCEEQRNINNYFNSGSGITPSSLIRHFRDKSLFVKVNTEKFQELFSLPLPRLEVNEILKVNEVLKTHEEQLKLDEAYFRVTKNNMSINPTKEEEDELKKIESHVVKMKLRWFSLWRELIDNAEIIYCKTLTSSEMLNRVSEDEALQNIDEMIKRRYVNKKNLQKLNDSLERATPEARKKIIEDYKSEAFSQWLSAINKSNNTKPLLNAVSHAKRMVLEERKTTYSNLTRFGDLMVYLAGVAAEKLTMGCNTTQFIHVLLGHKCAFFSKSDLRWNGILIGETCAGKSYLVEQVKKAAFPDTVVTISHQTDRSKNTQGMSPHAAATIFEDEISARKLFPNDQDDKHDAFKRLLTRPITTTVDFYIRKNPITGEEERTARTSITFNDNNMVVALNMPNKALTGTPIESRFCVIPVYDTKSDIPRLTCDRFLSSLLPRSDEDRKVFGGLKDNECIHILVESLCKSLTFEDVDLTIPMIVSWNVFEELEKMGFKKQPDRMKMFYLDLCRSATIFYAIDALFQSEIGRKYRFGEDKRDIKFDLNMLRDLEPWLVCTLEIAIFILTLLKAQIMKKTQLDFLSTLTKKVFKARPKGENDIHNFPWRKRERSFFNTTNNKRGPHKNVNTEDPDFDSFDQFHKTQFLDFNQIAISGQTLETLVNAVRKDMPQQPPLDEVMQAVKALEKTPVTKTMKWVNLHNRFDENPENIETEIVDVGKKVKGIHLFDVEASILDEFDFSLNEKDIRNAEKITREKCIHIISSTDSLYKSYCDCIKFEENEINQKCKSCSHERSFHCKFMKCKLCKGEHNQDLMFKCDDCNGWYCDPKENNQCQTQHCIECRHPMHRDCKKAFTCEYCGALMHDRCKYGHKDLMAVDETDDQNRINVIEVVRDKFQNKTILYISTAAMTETNSGIFDEIICRLFSHPHLIGDTTLVTANNLEFTYGDTQKTELLYDFLGTMELKKNLENPEIIVKNFQYSSEHFSRIFGRDNQKSEEDQTPFFKLDRDLDVVTIENRLVILNKDIENECFIQIVPFHLKQLINFLNERDRQSAAIVPFGKQEVDMCYEQNIEYPKFVIDIIRKEIEDQTKRAEKNYPSYVPFGRKSLKIDTSTYTGSLANCSQGQFNIKSFADTIISLNETRRDNKRRSEYRDKLI